MVTQVICFLLAIFGTAILLEHSTYDSRIQPMIRHTMTRLIMRSEYEPASEWLRLIQESVSFCVVSCERDFNCRKYIRFHSLDFVLLCFMLCSICVPMYTVCCVVYMENHNHSTIESHNRLLSIAAMQYIN